MVNIALLKVDFNAADGINRITLHTAFFLTMYGVLVLVSHSQTAFSSFTFSSKYKRRKSVWLRKTMLVYSYLSKPSDC